MALTYSRTETLAQSGLGLADLDLPVAFGGSDLANPEGSGIAVDNSLGVSCVFSAASGQTITGGTFDAYAMVVVTANKDGSPATYRWMRYPDLDFTPTVFTVRDIPTGDKTPYTGIGRVAWLPNAVTLSSGTTVEACYTARRRGRTVTG